MKTLQKHLLDTIKAYGICILILLGPAIGSGNNEEKNRGGKEEDVPLKLSSSTFMSTKRPFQLKAYANLSKLDLPTKSMKYKVNLYKINYKTSYKGKEITVSGIVLIPDTDDSVSIISFQHGTIARNDEAPSQLQSSDHELILYQAVASTGIMIVVPDFIGFGTSSDLMHPYYVEDVTATTVIDNIYAAENLAEEMGVKLNKKLYLAGYSQGGYATMATHKYIEEYGIKGFELMASFPSAGGYDLKGIQKHFFDMEICDQPFYLAYVAQAYQSVFDFESDLSCYFNEPYASAIPGLFDGTRSRKEINKMLNDTLSVLVSEEYLAGYGMDRRFEAMDRAFVDNSLIDWTPSIKLFMYHGDADKLVPYENSVATYNRFIENGASESIVNLITLPEAGHLSGILPYVERFVTEILMMEEL